MNHALKILIPVLLMFGCGDEAVYNGGFVATDPITGCADWNDIIAVAQVKPYDSIDYLQSVAKSQMFRCIENFK